MDELTIQKNIDDQLRAEWPDHPDLWKTYTWKLDDSSGMTARFCVRFRNLINSLRFVLVHQSTVTPGLIQVTTFDQHGPSGHSGWDSLEDVLKAPAHLSDVPALLRRRRCRLHADGKLMGSEP